MAKVLAGFCAVMVLVGLAINFFWRGPVSSEFNEADGGVAALPSLPPKVEELGAKSEYDVVNNRPLFSENRRPVVMDIEVLDATPMEIDEQEVAEAPKVRLTGVVITPTDRLVTLTPEEGGEAVVIREGMPLDGEFVGWSVDTVDAREVNLISARGETVKMELAVYDAMIEAPPMPEPTATATAAVLEEGEESSPGAAPSRADEIRERIRQRREELRAEAEAESAAQEDDEASTKDAYRDAIRSMMRRQEQEEEPDDSENE